MSGEPFGREGGASAGRFYRRHGKRMLEMCFTIPALLVLSPLLTVVALCVRHRLGSPVLFCQERPGLHGKSFTVVKFRTMTDHRDTHGNLLPDAQRLTGFGRFLRSTSLDELPELFNVLRGEMSLVGPRPLLPRYMGYYAERERKRFEVRPGITGWAQAHGRNELHWDQRLAHDVWYVEHMSLWLDLKIIGLTIWKVFRRENVQVDPQRVMLDLDEERRRNVA